MQAHHCTCQLTPAEISPAEALFSLRSRLVQVPPHSLNNIKQVKVAAGGQTTVNDVVFAAFAGAGSSR